MQQNAPFCVLLRNNFLGGGGNPRPHTAFSLSRVGMYAIIRGNYNHQRTFTWRNYNHIGSFRQRNYNHLGIFTQRNYNHLGTFTQRNDDHLGTFTQRNYDHLKTFRWCNYNHFIIVIHLQIMYNTKRTFIAKLRCQSIVTT
jgi:hypothetical protein